MNLHSWLRAAWHFVVVPTARLITASMIRPIRALVGVVGDVARAAWSWLGATWQRPVATVAVTLGAVTAWLVFGVPPLFWMLVSAAVFGGAAWLILRLWRWVMGRWQGIPEVPAQPPMPLERNNCRLNRKSAAPLGVR